MDNESCRSDCSSIISPQWEPLEVDEDDELTQTAERPGYYIRSYEHYILLVHSVSIDISLLTDDVQIIHPLLNDA